MPLTTIQKNNLKKMLKDKFNLDVVRFTPWKSAYQEQHKEEENYSVYFKGDRDGSYLNLKKESYSSKFSLNSHYVSSNILMDFYKVINQGIYSKMKYLMNIVEYDVMKVDERFDYFKIADGDLDDIENSINVEWSYIINYRYVPTQTVSDCSIYITESCNEVIFRAVNENLNDKANLLISAKKRFANKEDALKYLLIAFIEYINYKAFRKIPFENIKLEFFENVNKLDDLVKIYNDEKTVQKMMMI